MLGGIEPVVGQPTPRWSVETRDWVIAAAVAVLGSSRASTCRAQVHSMPISITTAAHAPRPGAAWRAPPDSAGTQVDAERSHGKLPLPHTDVHQN